MKQEQQIENNIEATFKTLDSIKEVKVNHFFKHKILQQIENNSEEKQLFLSWFTPKVQMSTLAFVLILNAGALFYAFSSQEDTSSVNLDSFAQEYSLQSNTNYILN